jgi:UTP-glucose-1-phosphate uridylyltransferase
MKLFDKKVQPIAKFMKPTLLILAAGMASRYGSMKQTEGFGPFGETIMDYSIYDAIKAGFGKVVFIIRKDFAENFKAKFVPKLEGKIEIDFVYQEMDAYVNAPVDPERKKPWGTGHAILCAKDIIREPFAVINADDYYGADAFQKASSFLLHSCNEKTYAIIGYELGKTLSDHGTVSRGVCEVDDTQSLVSIIERTKIYKKEDSILYMENDKEHHLPGGSSVSMNFWCFHQSIFESTERLFTAFLQVKGMTPGSEFFIPIIADRFIQEKENSIKVIPTTSQWFGVTYKEDAAGVKQNIDNLLKEGVYPVSLWG